VVLHCDVELIYVAGQAEQFQITESADHVSCDRDEWSSFCHWNNGGKVAEKRRRSDNGNNTTHGRRGKLFFNENIEREMASEKAVH